MAATRPVHLRASVVLGLGFLAGLLAYPYLPGPFLASRPSARILVAFTLPTTAVAIHALFRSLWTHDRVRSGNGAFESAYQAIVLHAMLFVVLLHVLTMCMLTGSCAAIGVDVSAGRVVVVLLGALLMLVGNLLPRTRPNVAVGVRTARTLANARLWQQVHRAGGYATVALGIVVVVTGMIAARDLVGPVVLAAALCAAIPVVVSYRRHAGA
jgi:immunity protein, SdpI family